MIGLGGFLFPAGLSLMVVAWEGKIPIFVVTGIFLIILGFLAWMVAFKLTLDRERHTIQEEARKQAEGILLIAHLKEITYELKKITQHTGDKADDNKADNK